MSEEVLHVCPIPVGKLLIIGGAENKGEEEAGKKYTLSDFERFQILKCFIKLSGKKDPAVEIITSATSEGKL